MDANSWRLSEDFVTLQSTFLIYIMQLPAFVRSLIGFLRSVAGGIVKCFTIFRSATSSHDGLPGGTDFYWREHRRRNMEELETYLRDNFVFRYNLITERTEWARKPDRESSEDLVFLPLDSRAMNTIAYNIIKDGNGLWDRDVKRIVESLMTAEYHPFKLYFDGLPGWDGRDRINSLAERVSSEPLWIKCFHRWMLAVVAQWMGWNGNRRANSVAPIIISTRQGLGKSTFCRMLMPAELRQYFTESYDLDAPSAAESKLATFGLINLDEFDKLSVKKMPLLKNLMQQEALNIRKAYKRSSESLRRIASFIGTSNRRDLLVDTTGSRRFVCVEIDSEIDCSPIEHVQIYAQLKHELISGERYWFSKDEEDEIQLHNQVFYRNDPAEEIFRKCFSLPASGEDAVFMTSSEIYETMRKRFPSVMRSVNINSLSRLLPSLAPRVHTKKCNGYYLKPLVVPLNEEV